MAQAKAQGLATLLIHACRECGVARLYDPACLAKFRVPPRSGDGQLLPLILEGLQWLVAETHGGDSPAEADEMM